MYFLEERVSYCKPMPYSYGRRALGTLHTDKWVQRYACEDKSELEKLLPQSHNPNYRIISNIPEVTA